MNTVRIALANIRYPASPEESVTLAVEAIGKAASQGAAIVCFPECYVPGYRGLGHTPPPPDAEFLNRAWDRVAKAAADAKIAVILGTERLVDDALRATALVVNNDGTIAGFQDKTQVDPSEDETYTPGSSARCSKPAISRLASRSATKDGDIRKRFDSRRGAGRKIVFHPHLHEAEPGSYRPTSFGDPANSFHEKAALCRAAENTCFFAMVNYASHGSPTTSAVARPDGTLLCHQPYGDEGLLIADVDLDEATLLLARRCKATW